MEKKVIDLQEKQQEVNKGLQDFIFQSKYARWMEDKKRRETWEEATERVRNMHLEKFDHIDEKYKEKIRWAFSLVRDKRVLPSMRSMQFGGKAVNAHNARGYNCLSSETRFVTSTGVKSFDDFNDGDEITVLGHSGKWRKAIVRNYGKQILRKNIITRAKSSYEIWATDNHRWLLKNKDVVEGLKEGNLLRGSENIFSDFIFETSSIEEQLYWCYGYVYGDGTISGERSVVRLCGEQIKYEERFTNLGFKSSSPLSCKGDIICYTGKYQKNTPNPEIDSPKLIRAFVAGYLAADGANNKNSNKKYNTKNPYRSIQSSELDHIEFIRKCFPIAGVFIVSEKELTGQKTNFGIRPYTISFRIVTGLSNEKNYNVPFRVSVVSEETKIEDVWCLEVEEDNSFVLSNGLVTGNCSVRHIDSIRAFAEIAYLMLCGCGTGIGISKRFLGRLPNLVDQNDKTGTVVTYVIEDTIEGWADSLEALLACYFKNTCYSGRKIIFDYSKIRRKGVRLKIGGGKAPGYKPLKNALNRIKILLDHIIEVNAQYRLSSINVYDILMHFSDAVLSGGSRRTASSVIFDIDDDAMIESKIVYKVKKVIHTIDEETNVADCKLWINHKSLNQRSYNISIDLNKDKWLFDNLVENKEIGWFQLEPQRARSNNSILLLRDKITKEQLTDIFNKTKQFGEPGFVFANHPDTLYNPCFEIGFVPVTRDGRCGVQFCNLTSSNGALIKTLKDFLECVEAQSIIGSLQATYTSFPYLSPVAQQLTEEEALLGNSITGIMDSPSILLNEENLREGARRAVEVNVEWAKILGINAAARINAIKPEGTGSLAVGSAPGAHAHHYYEFFRRVQTPKDENIYGYFKEINPHMCEESIWNTNTKEDVVTFPIKAPEGAIVKDDLTAIKHLDIIKSLQRNWVLPAQANNQKEVNNNVSCTVIVKDDEWDSVVDYLYENREYFSAVSFISYYGDKIYKQAPYEKISTDEDKEKYKNYLVNYKVVDYTQMVENQDETNLTAEAVCAGGACIA